MKTQTIILILGIALLGIWGCNEQSTGPVQTADEMAKMMDDDEAPEGPGMGKMPMRHLARVLDLTDEQKAQIKDIFESRKETCGGRAAFKGLSKEERRAKRKECRNAIHAEIAKVLTAEQKALLEDTKAKIEAGEVPEAMIDKMVARMTEKLNLTEEQQAQVKTVMVEVCKERLAAKADGKKCAMRGHGRKRGHKGLCGPGHKAMKEKLDAILTDEQKQILEEMHSERKARRQERREEKRGKRLEKRLERMTAELDLTDEQQAKIKVILEEAHTRGKPHCNDRESCRAARKERMEKTHAAIKEVLTPEQREKFEEWVAKHKERKGRRGPGGPKGRGTHR